MTSKRLGTYTVETFGKRFTGMGATTEPTNPNTAKKGFDGLCFTDTRDVETFSGKSFRPSRNP